MVSDGFRTCFISYIVVFIILRTSSPKYACIASRVSLKEFIVILRIVEFVTPAWLKKRARYSWNH